MRDFIKITYQWFRQLTLWQKVALGTGISTIILLLIPLATYAYFARDISDPERLMNRKNTGIVLLDKSGEEFFSAYNAASRESIPLEAMPEHLRQALIATEDRNFYEHDGYSVRSTLAALYGNILSQDAKRFGGSTITQQLVKNALLTNDKKYLRKYQELSLAIAVDRRYSKDKILEMYLNSVYFGEGAFGVEDAAQVYFGKPAKDLGLAQSSFLIGLLPAPSALSPISGDRQAAKERQEVVLGSMVEAGNITSAKKEEVFARSLQFQPAGNGSKLFAQHYAQMVMSELMERYGEEEVTRSGFRVTTTLDGGWQKQAETIVKDHIAQIAYSGANNAALVAIDPGNGEVRALVGSVDWNNKRFGQVNMAVTPRQPGSSFKPIYYTEALRQKLITPATILRDEPTTFGSSYQPENYDFAYRGDITVRRALANSLNIPSVKVMEQLGVAEAIETADRMGLEIDASPEELGLSLALGTAEVELLNMTNAYAAFAGQGNQFEPTLIASIKDKYNKTIFEYKPQDERATDEDAAFLISSILSDDTARAATFGSSLSIGRPAAVKTGSTEDNRDAWTIGYTPGLVTGVWVGNNEHEPMGAVGGSAGAGPIWVRAMQDFLAGSPTAEFQQPSGVEEVFVCTINGSYNEFFIRGTSPEACSLPPPPPKPERKPPREDEEEPEEEPAEPEPDEEPVDQLPEENPDNDTGGVEDPDEDTDPSDGITDPA